MPEAALARELDLCYAHCAVSANWAAGRSEGIIEMHEIEANLDRSMQEIRTLLGYVLANT
jgi:5'-methylthioinosine phosphorylase